MNPRFVHLRLHTEYSLVDGTVRDKPLMKTAAAQGMPAIALTDQSNLFAMVKFYKAALAAGIKPIIGVDAWIRPAVEAEQPSRMVLLCMNSTGYQNLTQLVSRSYLDGQHSGMPMIEVDWLREHSCGLIALPSPAGSPMSASTRSTARSSANTSGPSTGSSSCRSSGTRTRACA